MLPVAPTISEHDRKNRRKVLSKLEYTLFFLPIHRRFHILPLRLVAVKGLGMTNQKIATFHRRIVHPVDKFVLRRVVKVNHDIAAPDTIEVFLERKRLVHQVEPPVCDFLSDLIVSDVTIGYFFEILVDQRRRHSLHAVLRVCSLDRLSECFFGYIGRKKPAIPIVVIGTEEFHKRHNQCVRLFACRCRRTPNPNIVVLLLSVRLDYPGQDVALEKIKVIRLTEEKRMIGRNLICQFTNKLIGLVRNDHVIVLFECFALILFEQLLKPTNDETFFLVGESNPESVVNQIADGVELRVGNVHHFSGQNGGIGHGTSIVNRGNAPNYTVLVMCCNHTHGWAVLPISLLARFPA